MKQPKVFNSNADLLKGDKLYIQRARIAFPLLVRQAKAGEPISYSSLAEEMKMPNPRNLNYVLGAIGVALQSLAERLDIPKIPVINCLVINKANHLPGEGIGWFIDKKDFSKLTRSQKRETVIRLLDEIYVYPAWDMILREFGLEPARTNYEKKLKPLLLKSQSRWGGGESKSHLDFKNYLAKHPELFELTSDYKAKTEYELPSADAIDVVFEQNGEIIGVEAKSIISDSGDILRGLFQCVKYKALLEAEQIVKDLVPNCHVFLALEGKFPEQFIGIRNQLGINVIDNITS
ncbi:MAG: hypothetical protein WCI92_08185 [Bacteroidota bacterium]